MFFVLNNQIGVLRKEKEAAGCKWTAVWRKTIKSLLHLADTLFIFDANTPTGFELSDVRQCLPHGTASTATLKKDLL